MKGLEFGHGKQNIRGHDHILASAGDSSIVWPWV